MLPLQLLGADWQQAGRHARQLHTLPLEKLPKHFPDSVSHSLMLRSKLVLKKRSPELLREAVRGGGAASRAAAAERGRGVRT